MVFGISLTLLGYPTYFYLGAATSYLGTFQSNSTSFPFTSGPILLLAFVNELPDAPSFNIPLLVDDVKLISARFQHNELRQNLESAFQ